MYLVVQRGYFSQPVRTPSPAVVRRRVVSKPVLLAPEDDPACRPGVKGSQPLVRTGEKLNTLYRNEGGDGLLNRQVVVYVRLDTFKSGD